PDPKITKFLLLALGISLPFAHFVVFIVSAFGIQWNIQWANIFGGLLLLHLFIRVLLGNPIKISPGLIWIGLFICATFVSAFNFFTQPPEYFNKFLNYEILLILYTLLFISITQVRTDSKHLLGILKAMLVLSTIVGLYGVYQLPARYLGLPFADITLTNPQFPEVKFVGEEAILNLARPNSIFSEPGFFGHYLVPFTVLGIILALRKPDIFGSKIILWAIVIAQMVSLALTFSMGSYYVMGLVVLLMLFIERGRSLANLIGWIIFGAIVINYSFLTFELITGFPVYTMSVERMFGLWKYLFGDINYLVPFESAPYRLSANSIAFKVFAMHPLTGIGLGLWANFAQNFVKTPVSDLSTSPFAVLLADTGILGASAFLSLGIGTLWHLYKLIKKSAVEMREAISSGLKPDKEFDILVRLVFYLVLTEMIYFHVDGRLFVPTIWYYFGLGNLMIIMARNRKFQSA
ncbi:MAG: hypothetical protein ABIC40_02935, partial [bacterium]